MRDENSLYILILIKRTWTKTEPLININEKSVHSLKAIHKFSFIRTKNNETWNDFIKLILHRKNIQPKLVRWMQKKSYIYNFSHMLHDFIRFEYENVGNHISTHPFNIRRDKRQKKVMITFSRTTIRMIICHTLKRCQWRLYKSKKFSMQSA